MTFTEILRVRRALTNFTIVIVAVCALALIGIFSSHSSVTVHADGHTTHINTQLRAALASDFAKNNRTIPLSILFFFAAYGATIIGSFFATTLARERLVNAPLAWTKPVSRVRFALAYFAVDAAGMAAAFVVGLVLAGFVIAWAAGVGQYIRIDADAWPTLALSAGMAFAYYGLVRMLTTAFPERSGAIAGTSWAIAYVLIALAAVPLPTILHDIVVVLDLLNPLAYLTSFGARGEMVGALDISTTVRIVCVWTLAIITGVAAIVIYRRAEA